MGGCASKPKGMDLHPTDEVTVTPTNKPQPQPVETICQGINDRGVSASTTLVDLSESNKPKQEEAGGDVEPKHAYEVYSNDHKSTTTPIITQTEKVEEVIAKESEDKSLAIVQNTQTKEGHPRTTGVDVAESNVTLTPTSQHKTTTPVDVAII